jgi:hypothetical protein
MIQVKLIVNLVFWHLTLLAFLILLTFPIFYINFPILYNIYDHLPIVRK